MKIDSSGVNTCDDGHRHFKSTNELWYLWEPYYSGSQDLDGIWLSHGHALFTTETRL